MRLVCCYYLWLQRSQIKDLWWHAHIAPNFLLLTRKRKLALHFPAKISSCILLSSLCGSVHSSSDPKHEEWWIQLLTTFSPLNVSWDCSVKKKCRFRSWMGYQKLRSCLFIGDFSCDFIRWSCRFLLELFLMLGYVLEKHACLKIISVICCIYCR